MASARGTSIIDLAGDDHDRLVQAAILLVDGCSDTGSATWRTRDAALVGVQDSLQQDRISRVAP
jgi:hypothetical protein